MSTRQAHLNAAYGANISGSDELFITTTIDRVVKHTGLPAVGKVLQDEGMADRTTLRRMERKGLIKRMPINGGQGIHYGYYTENELPKAVKEWRAKQDGDVQHVGAGADEGDRPEAHHTGTSQERT